MEGNEGEKKGLFFPLFFLFASKGGLIGGREIKKEKRGKGRRAEEGWNVGNMKNHLRPCMCLGTNLTWGKMTRETVYLTSAVV